MTNPSKIAKSTASLLAGMMVVCGCLPASNTPNSTRSQPSNKQAAAVAPEFKEVGTESGFTFTYHNGKEAQHNAILESLGGGVGILDYDRDGRPDLFLPSGGKFEAGPTIVGLASALFRQVDEGRFVEQSISAGVATPKQYSHGVAIGDFDNDGFPDVLVTGYGTPTVWHNCGDGSFQDVTSPSGMIDRAWSSSAGWGDVNGDGALDVYFAHYADWSFENHPRCGTAAQPDVCPPRRFQGLDHALFLADGAGSFADATAKVGLKPKGKGLGVVLVDLDDDTDLDIYVANDTDDNWLYINDGTGHFDETGMLSGTAVDDKAQPNGSMGVAVIDYNTDGRVDLCVANYEDEAFALYQNNSGVLFSHVSSKTGIEAIGRLQVGFGTVTGDIDGDGDEDIVVSNGHVIHHPINAPLRQEPLILLNDGRSRFQRATIPPDQYFSRPHMGRGLAHGDLDGDGDLDLVFAHSNEPSAILMNQREAHGRWLVVDLVGTVSPRDGTGAKVVLETSQGKLIRHAFGGGSYLSASARSPHFGYSPEMIPRGLKVYWPSGRVSDLTLTAAHLSRKRMLIVE